MILVEQNVNQALKIADYGYVLTSGKIFLSGTYDELYEEDSSDSGSLDPFGGPYLNPDYSSSEDAEVSDSDEGADDADASDSETSEYSSPRIERSGRKSKIILKK